MKKRQTVERWVSEILPSPELIKRADLKDREIDQKVGAQKKAARSKLVKPECDWRTLSKTHQGSRSCG